MQQRLINAQAHSPIWNPNLMALGESFNPLSLRFPRLTMTRRKSADASVSSTRCIVTPMQRIVRLLLFVAGALSIFCFFFSVIGVLIGTLYFVLLRDRRWRLHGLVLALSAAISEFAAHTGTALEPLHLAMRTGPTMLASSLIVQALVPVLARCMGPGVTRWLSTPWLARFSASLSRIRRIGSRAWRMTTALLTVVLALIPLGLWASVSLDFGVLLDNAPRMLWIHAPSTVDPGAQFEFSVQAWDAYERLSAVYRGTVDFQVASYDVRGRALGSSMPIGRVPCDLPPPYTFRGADRASGMAYRLRDGKDNGRRVFQARIHSPGLHYLLVHDSETGNTYYSNPIEVPETGGNGGRIFWGDIHSHSGLSDGSGSPEHSFSYARHVACLDFFALTDHGEILMFHPGGFDRVERLANEAYEAGRFVSFQGVEWTQVRTGHYTCIFSGDRVIREPRLSYLTVPTAEGLWDALDAFTRTTGCRALALPHHTTQNSYLQDWTHIDPRFVKLAEVCSVHGEFLFEPRHPLNYRGAIDPTADYVHGASITDALIMGKRLILYAASDAHDGRPGHSLSHTSASIGHQRPLTSWHPRIGHPYPGGLTAVEASELTREAVFAALEEGRVFACSDHGRPLLRFTLNGLSAGRGGRLSVPHPTAPRTIEVFLAQDGSPAAGRHSSAFQGMRAAETAAEAHPSDRRQTGWNPDWSADIEIIKNGELFAVLRVADPVSRVEHIDREPVTGASYGRERCFETNGLWYINRYSDSPVDPAELHTGGEDFYLVRVVGRNGRSAYAGPIWVTVAAP